MTQNQQMFEAPASETILQRVAVRIRERNIEVVIIIEKNYESNIKS